MTQLSLFGEAEFAGLLADTTQKSASGFLVEIGIPANDDMFMQVNTRAVAAAQARAADLVTEIDEATRNEIRDLVTYSLSDGLTYKEVSERLQEMYSFSDTRADLIARTESAIANNQGILSGMKELKAQGSKIKKAWLPDADACDEICIPNGEQGFIELEDDFDSGDDAPPGHPNCRCNMISEIDDKEDDDES